MPTVYPTQIDALRAVARLDANASAGIGDTLPPGAPQGAEGWEMRDVVRSVATHIGDAYGAHYGRGSWSASAKIGKVTARDVSIMLIAWGASPFTVQQWARRIASDVRGDQFRAGA